MTLTSMITRVEDAILARIQKRCQHPGVMVAADILEGSGGDVELKYCRRCGAVKPVYGHPLVPNRLWRLPDPNLWRG